MRTFASILTALTLVACGGGGNSSSSPDAGGTPDHPIIVPCPDCPDFPPLDGDGSKPECTGDGVDPTLIYPPDGVLLPPNMNVIEVHFLPGEGNTIFEIDFENDGTDVRFETRCDAVTNTRGSDTGGCSFRLDVTDWNYVARLNRGGDPVTVTVRAAPEDVSCVSGSNSRTISYADEDLTGGIYYWQSVTQDGVAGTTGGIFRKDFGNPDPTLEPFLTPGDQNKCVGCHFLSRDGLRMTYGSDDADSDDEYGDLHVTLYDVENRVALAAGKAPAGFQTFTRDHSQFLASDGVGKSATSLLDVFDGETATLLGAPTFPALSGKRVTNPDLDRDGTTVYFTVATPITLANGYKRKDDLHCMNGSIYRASYNASMKTMGAAEALVTAADADENNYYPAIAPDGTSLVFNRAVGTALDTHDSYNNPNAELYAMSVPDGTPIPLTKANLHDKLTNSWPRWSPFVQSYKGKHIVWVTFSSTRDYGLRVQNEDPPTGPTFNCYPPVSPEDTSGDHDKPFDPDCTQPQIWMTAVVLEDLAAGDDPSYPAFWLPFQEPNAHNHIAQWVETVTPPETDCQHDGEDCSDSMPCCSGSLCSTTSMTCQSIVE